jgi:hypothetical protein
MVSIGAAFMLASAVGTGGATHASEAPRAPTASASEADAASADSAQAWFSLIGGHDWAAAWRASGALMTSRLTEQLWTAKVEPVRTPLGKVVSRVFQTVIRTATLPGAPDGDYEVLTFRTSFTNKRDATETVVLAHEGQAWKADGYFIR